MDFFKPTSINLISPNAEEASRAGAARAAAGAGAGAAGADKRKKR